MCDEWRYDPSAFIGYIERELGPRPPGQSLDRMDNDSDYRPGNVKWSTPLEQARNRRPRHGVHPSHLDQLPAPPSAMARLNTDVCSAALACPKSAGLPP